MYCSMGLDARLVYTVELHRRRSALLNKVWLFFTRGAFVVSATDCQSRLLAGQARLSQTTPPPRTPASRSCTS
jgi:hypothetical protein